MSGHELRTITSQHESRISKLEKRQADRETDAENGAHMPSASHLEGPPDLLKTLEEGISLIRNATQSLDVTKGRALANIAVKAAAILPLIEVVNAQAEDRDKIRREQEVGIDIVSKNAKARQTVEDMMDLEFEIKELAEKRFQAKLRSENELHRAPEEKEPDM